MGVYDGVGRGIDGGLYSDVYVYVGSVIGYCGGF